MGLLVSVYRNAEFEADGTDCTNGGLSGRFRKLLIVNVPGPTPDNGMHPAMLLVDDQPCGEPYPKLVPADPDDHDKPYRSPTLCGPMMGGNYAGSSDSRLGQAVHELCGLRLSILPVHDRFESPQLYRLLSTEIGD